MLARHVQSRSLFQHNYVEGKDGKTEQSREASSCEDDEDFGTHITQNEDYVEQSENAVNA